MIIAESDTIKKSQLVLISLMLFVISKSYKIQRQYLYLDTKEIFLRLIELLLPHSKNDIVKYLESVNYYQDDTSVNDAYDEITEDSIEYPYAEQKDSETWHIQVPNLPDKRLCVVD